MATDATIDHITRLDEATAMERVKCERELSELRIIVERLEVYQSTTTMSI